VNLAKQARSAVSQFLLHEVSQQSFANLIDTSVRTIRGWEQDRRIPRGPTTVLLQLIIHSTEFIVVALAQYHPSARLRFEVSLEQASDFVQRVMIGIKSEEEKREAMVACCEKLILAKEIADKGAVEIISGIRFTVRTVPKYRIIEIIEKN